jgi:hypothetical protein
MIEEIINDFRRQWPAVFAGTAINQMSGNAINWETIQNKRCLDEIPAECFIKSGPSKVLIVRDPFLDWWKSTLRSVEKRKTANPQPRAGCRQHPKIQTQSFFSPAELQKPRSKR